MNVASAPKERAFFLWTNVPIFRWWFIIRGFDFLHGGCRGYFRSVWLAPQRALCTETICKYIFYINMNKIYNKFISYNNTSISFDFPSCQIQRESKRSKHPCPATTHHKATPFARNAKSRQFLNEQAP
jgi:hypothetical protein